MNAKAAPSFTLMKAALHTTYRARNGYATVDERCHSIKDWQARGRMPPTNVVVICVDEKPSIQAVERTTGYVETDNGKT